MSFVAFINGLVLMFFAALMGLNALFFPQTAGVFVFSMTFVGIIGLMLSVASMGRWKAVIGPKLKARSFENQKTEAKIGARILDRMTELGRPNFERTA